MSDHIVSVSNGKYTFRIEAGPTVFIDRGGVYWHAQQEAFNALHSMMCELDAARVVVEAARELAKRNEAPAVLYAALLTHASLVNDNQKPSAWAREAQP